MKTLHRLFIQVRFLILIPLSILLWGTGGILLSYFDPGGHRVYNWIGRTWTRIVLVISGVRIVVRGKENLTVNDGPFVVIFNHQSYVDIPVIVQSLPLQLRFVGKRDLLKVPFFGGTASRSGHIFIERSNYRDSLKGLKEAGNAMRELGVSIVMAPEGTRSTTGNLLPFKKGAFILALEAGLPILPVIIQGSREIMPKGSYTSLGGTVRVTVCKPIPTSDYTYAERNLLLKEVRGAMDDQLKDM